MSVKILISTEGKGKQLRNGWYDNQYHMTHIVDVYRDIVISFIRL